MTDGANAGARERAFAATYQRLIGIGYSPLPIVPGTKRPAMPGWQDACSGPLNATTLDRFATPRCAYGIGVALGYRDLVAIDIDTDDPEIKTALCRAIRGSIVAKRGRKGSSHFYRFRGATPRKWKGRDGGMIVELLAHGNQTVIPPTIHPHTGEPYDWLGRRTLLDTSPVDLPELPQDIADRITHALWPWLPPPANLGHRCRPDQIRRPGRYLAAAIRGECAMLSRVAEGGRNHALNDSAFRLALRHGLTEAELLHHLAPVAAEIGLPHREIISTIHSAARGAARATGAS